MSESQSQNDQVVTELSADALFSKGFICYNGYPVAFVKKDFSVQLLLPYSQLQKRPYYSVSYNGFIEIDRSLSTQSEKWTQALISEWGARYFGAPKNKDRETMFGKSFSICMLRT